MKAYWNSLNERERLVLSIGVGFCCCYLFYLLFYAPLARAVHNNARQLIEKQQTLVWLEQVRHLHKAKKVPETLSSAKLLTVLAEQLNTTSFTQFPYQLKQTGVSDIQLIFEQVPYNAFIHWLSTINDKYTVSIKQLTIERTKTAGVVKLMVIISN